MTTVLKIAKIKDLIIPFVQGVASASPHNQMPSPQPAIRLSGRPKRARSLDQNVKSIEDDSPFPLPRGPWCSGVPWCVAKADKTRSWATSECLVVTGPVDDDDEMES
jgi:hypothetical protein